MPPQSNDQHRPPVGAGLPAKEVNDDEGWLEECGALRFFASKLAPTGGGVDRKIRCSCPATRY
ncbi:hypothetical protein ELQ88_18850 [Pseudomonas sp. MPC6]|nr:hypothetical protein ELQ88_18850 [Pseudomonas sp. MPC6]